MNKQDCARITEILDRWRTAATETDPKWKEREQDSAADDLADYLGLAIPDAFVIVDAGKTYVLCGYRYSRTGLVHVIHETTVIDTAKPEPEGGAA